MSKVRKVAVQLWSVWDAAWTRDIIVEVIGDFSYDEILDAIETLSNEQTPEPDMLSDELEFTWDTSVISREAEENEEATVWLERDEDGEVYIDGLLPSSI